MIKVKQVLTPPHFFAVELENSEDVIKIAEKLGKPVFEDNDRVFVIDGKTIYWAAKVG